MRSIGLRLAFLGATAALLAVLGVYALFTDSDTGTGSASAGTVVVLVAPTTDIATARLFPHPFATLAYDGGCDPANMGVGDMCDESVNVFNDGTLDFTYTVSPFVLSQSPASPLAYPACWDITITGPTDAGGDGDLFIVPDGREAWTIKVTMLDNNDCQGMEANLGMEVIATQVP